MQRDPTALALAIMAGLIMVPASIWAGGYFIERLLQMAGF